MSISPTSGIINSASQWYKAATKAGEIPFWIILGITLYMPFEEFILKWIPISEIGIALLRFLPEIVLYGLMIQVLGTRLLRGDRLKSTPIDILLVLFLISTGISAILNGSRLFPCIENLRALWRYLSVFYVVTNIEVTVEQFTLILKSIRIIGVIQGLLAIFQYFMPPNIQKIFIPRKFEIGDYERVAAAESGNIKSGAVFGMFEHPAVLSAFLLIAALLAISSFMTTPGDLSVKLKALPEIMTLMFGLFVTKKRAPLMLALCIPLILLLFRKKIRSFLKLGWVYIALIFAIVILTFVLGGGVDTSFSSVDERKGAIDITSYFAQIFSADYYERSAEHARGWVIRVTFSTLIQSGSWFGFGPDLENMRHLMYDLMSDGGDRAKIFALDPFEDVYWVAMLAYYGPVGMCLYSLILWRLYKAGKAISKFSPHKIYRTLGANFCTLILLTIAFNFISRTIKFRAFSFLFWLFSGLVINTYNSLKAREDEIQDYSKKNIKILSS